MKNFILPCFLLFTASAVYAENFQEAFPDEYITSISPDGKWVAGALDDGNVIIRNLETDESFEYFSNGGSINYYIGNGATPISNVGIIAGSTNGNNASYWDNGQWYNLKTPNPDFMSNACSITPDGSIICGGAGNDNMSLDSEKIMLVPAIWVRQDDGFYSDAILLPHPDVDFTGRTPQYITATTISDDGKTIMGQIRDYLGFMMQPIKYTCDDNGEWSYTLLYPELLNPTGVEFPKYPGEYHGDPMPSQEWFMTPEEMAAYSEAVDNWKGGTDFPEYSDFMTPEEIEEYLEAFNAYLDQYIPWEEEYDKFAALYDTCITEGYVFVFNNGALTPDGKYLATTREITYVDDPFDGPKTRMYPVILNTDGSGYTDLNGTGDISLLSSGITANGDVLAVYIDPEWILPRQAYIFLEGSKEATHLEEYIREINPEVADWMEDEMLREVIDGITPAGEFTFRDFMCSGSPISTPDLSRILCFTTTDTWAEANAYYYTWIFDTGLEPSAVKPVLTADASLEVVNGTIVLNGEFQSVDVYDISGAAIYTANRPTGTINPNLGKGIYIIKAITANGEELVKKIAF